MRIIAKSTLRDFWEQYPAAELLLRTWFKDVAAASWASPNEVKASYRGNVSVLVNSRLVFNIKGHDFRLVVWMNYEFATVYIRFVGTHAAYDRIDATTI